MRHRRIDLDSSVAAVAVAMEALRVARSQQTSTNGTSAWRNPDGTETVVGPGAGLDETGAPNGIIQWVGDTTPPGKPTGISCSSAWGVLYVKWDGTLAGGVPADFAYVSILVDGEEIARMFEAGTAVRDGLADGAEVEVSAVAYDSARDREGNLDPNASEPFGPVTVEISDERAGIEADVQSAAQKAEEAAAKADSYQSQIDDVTATVNGVEQEVSGFSTQIQGAVEDASQALTAATEASQNLEGFKATVSQTYETKADADAAMAQEVLDRNSAIEQSAGEILSTVSQNYVDNETGETLATKAEVSQTASQIKQEVSEEYQVKGDYLTEDEAASSYASKSELTQTADSIKAEVAQDYQSKDGMSSYATKSYVEQQDNSIKSTVSSVQTTANNALSKASAVEQTADGLEVRLTQAEKDVDTANSTASTASTNATNALNRVTLKDTRNDNQNPQWYMTNYPMQQVQEFKICSKIGLSGVGGTYCYMTTYVPWGDSSGGYPKQTAKVDSSGKEYWRSGTSNTAWSAWVDAYGTATNAAKTATNFLKFDSAGLCVGNQTGTLGYNTLIKSGGMDIRNGTTVLASFTSSQIDLGKNSRSTTINMANGGVIISADDNSARFDSGFDGSIVIGGASTATTGGSHAAISVSKATITLNTAGMLDDGGVYVNGKAVQPFIGITGWTYIYGSSASGEFVRVRKMGSYLVVMQWDFTQESTTYWAVPNLLPSSMRPSEGVYAAAARTDSGHNLTNNTAYVFVGGGGAVGFQCGNSQSGYNAGTVAWFTG